MKIDFFGIAKRRELLKAALKREIERELQPGSRSYLQGWEEKDKQEGRKQQVSYTALEAVYKKESWVRACLTAESKLYTINGDLKNISNITTKDKVINKNGKFSDISETMELNYSGDLYEFERWYGAAYKIKATADHPFLVFCNNKIVWKKAEEITKDDLFVEPIYKDEKDLNSYKLHVTNNHKNTIQKYIDYNKEVPINEETMRVIGYFLAEGSTSGKKQTDFALGLTDKENEYVDDLCCAVSASFGLKLNVRKDVIGGTSRIVSHSRTLKEFLRQFGTRAWNKKIPNWVLSLPNHKTKELLKTFWFGDGCYSNKKQACFDSTSLALLEGVRILLLRHGIVSSITKNYEGDGSISYIAGKPAKRNHSLYRLSIYGKHLQNFLLIFNMDDNYCSSIKPLAHIENNLVFYKIKNIKKIRVENIKVYNIEVPNTNSYVVNGIISHNCIDVITRTTTSNGYRLVAEDSKEQVDPKSKEFAPILSLLNQPNPNDTFEEVLAEICTDLHIYGDAYLEIVRDKQGNPVALYNIYAPSLRVLVDAHGTVLGYVQIPMGMLSRGAKAVTFKANDVAHFRLPNPGNEVYGLSPIESLDIVIETDLYAQDYNRNFFKNHAVPRLHVDLSNCTLPQLKRVREYFNSYFKGSKNAHKTIVTEGGAKITPIGTKPNDMEFLNQRKFSRDEICSVFGVPPMKLGIFEDVNRASSSEADKSFKSEKIIPLQRMISKKINATIIKEFNKIGDKVRFEFVEVDLRDEKEQAEIDKINIDSGVLTVDEVRRKKGLPAKNKK